MSVINSATARTNVILILLSEDINFTDYRSINIIFEFTAHGTNITTFFKKARSLSLTFDFRLPSNDYPYFKRYFNHFRLKQDKLALCAEPILRKVPRLSSLKGDLKSTLLMRKLNIKKSTNFFFKSRFKVCQKR